MPRDLKEITKKNRSTFSHVKDAPIELIHAQGCRVDLVETYLAGVDPGPVTRYYIGHDYKGHNYIGHNYTAHNYTAHNYIGHDYIGRDYRSPLA